jgi:molybdopterin molybdotransferase
MISLKNAENIISGMILSAPETELVQLNDSIGRTLAADFFSDVDMPPFDKSAMDGYACRIADIQHPLKVLETIAAGSEPTRALGEMQCSKIMTGARIPEGADCVIVVEQSMMTGIDHIQFTGVKTERNICYRGEDVKKNDLMLPKGSLIQPQTLAILASAGGTNILVFKKIEVGFICTGSELVEPEIFPEGVKIRNSNASQLNAQIVAAGAIPVYEGIIPDSSPEIAAKIEDMLTHYQIVVVTGGASVGDYDFIPEILNQSGFTLHFQKLAIQPGKPVLFASRNNKFVFGLSGNPVSSFLQFKLLVDPFISLFYGVKHRIKDIATVAGEDLNRKKADRMMFLPVVLNEDGLIIRKEYHGSAHIAALQDVFGFAIIPQEIHEIKKGSLVYVRPI